MSLESLTDEELAAQLKPLQAEHRRRLKEHEETVREAHRCKRCGSLPVEIMVERVREERLSPRDGDGRVRAPYYDGEGQLVGVWWRTATRCEQGHVRSEDEFKVVEQ